MVFKNIYKNMYETQIKRQLNKKISWTIKFHSNHMEKGSKTKMLIKNKLNKHR